MYTKHGNLVDADASGNNVGFSVGNFERKVRASPFSRTQLSLSAPV